MAAGALEVNFPLSSQIPPIARVRELFQFRLAATTFQPDPDELQYSLLGAPSWLSLEEETRTLRGTPQMDRRSWKSWRGGKFGVSTDEPPSILVNVSEVLLDAGPLSAPDTLSLLPTSPFRIDFPADTFRTKQRNPSYHASLSDHTPLPAWIKFDSKSLVFSGNTPPASSSPLVYDITLLISEDTGYASASLPFRVTVSSHQLLLKNVH